MLEFVIWWAGFNGWCLTSLSGVDDEAVHQYGDLTEGHSEVNLVWNI